MSKRKLTKKEIELKQLQKFQNEQSKEIVVYEIIKLNETIKYFIRAIKDMKPEDVINELDYVLYGTRHLKSVLNLDGLLNLKEILEDRINKLTEIRNKLIEKELGEII